jgi:hypothetical protein
MGQSCVHGIAFGSPAQVANETAKSNVNMKTNAGNAKENKGDSLGYYTSCS